MADKSLCAAAAVALTAVPAASKPNVLVGFDGFIDNIIDVVAKRESSAKYSALSTIAEFGSRVSAAAGQSEFFRLLPRRIEKPARYCRPCRHG